MNNPDLIKIKNNPNHVVLLKYAFCEQLDQIKEIITSSETIKSLDKARLKLIKLKELPVHQHIEKLEENLKSYICPSCQIIIDRVIKKPGKSQQHTPWHQDGAYWNEAGYIRIWIALDDFDEESGCLKFLKVPINKIHPHTTSLKSDFFSKELNTNKHSKENTFSAPVKKGDILLFSEYSVHSAFPNRAEDEKYSLTGVIELNPHCS